MRAERLSESFETFGGRRVPALAAIRLRSLRHHHSCSLRCRCKAGEGGVRGRDALWAVRVQRSCGRGWTEVLPDLSAVVVGQDARPPRRQQLAACRLGDQASAGQQSGGQAARHVRLDYRPWRRARRAAEAGEASVHISVLLWASTCLACRARLGGHPLSCPGARTGLALTCSERLELEPHGRMCLGNARWVASGCGSWIMHVRRPGLL